MERRVSGEEGGLDHELINVRFAIEERKLILIPAIRSKPTVRLNYSFDRVIGIREA